MAKVKGPLFSLEARGSIGGCITYMPWRGQPRVRRLVIPLNRNTEDQQEVRAQFTLAVKGWHGLSDEEQEKWDDEVYYKGVLMSGFNLFVGEYISYIRDEAGDPPIDPDLY